MKRTKSRVSAAFVLACTGLVWLAFTDRPFSAAVQPQPFAATDSEHSIDTEQETIRRLKSTGAGVSGKATGGFHVSIGQKIDPAAIKLLARMPHLRWLEVQADWLTDAHLEQLRHLAGLEIVELDAPQVTDRGVAQLASCSRLFRVSLHNSGLSDDGLSAIAHLSKLVHLELRWCRNVHGAGLKYLRGLPKLSELVFQGNGLHEAELSQLVELGRLHMLQLRDEPITDAALPQLTKLSRLKKLDELDLYDTQITSEGAQRLRRTLPGVVVVRADIGVGQRKLRQIGAAFEKYRVKHGHRPPAVLLGPDGRTPYSWRVAILPELGERQLFEQYRLDQAWDREANLKVLRQMPEVYRLPGMAAGTFDACHFALVGPTAMFSDRPGEVKTVGRDDSRVMIVEARRERIPWTQPADIPYDDDRPLPKLGGIHKQGFNALFSDGSPQFLVFYWPLASEAWDEFFRTISSTNGNEIWKRKIAKKLVGKTAPDFTLKNLGGQDVTLSKLIAGKAALVVFSAVGCGPCRIEAPHLSAIYEKHKDQGLVVLAVDGWHEPANLVRQYVEKKKLKHLYVVEGDTVAHEKYHVRGWPMSCWVDHRRVIVKVHFGFDDGDERTLAKEAQDLIAERRRNRR